MRRFGRYILPLGMVALLGCDTEFCVKNRTGLVMDVSIDGKVGGRLAPYYFKTSYKCFEIEPGEHEFVMECFNCTRDPIRLTSKFYIKKGQKLLLEY